MTLNSLAGAALLPELTVAYAWNGKGDPHAAFAAAQAGAFVAELLVSPIDAATALAAVALSTVYPKLRILPPGDTGIYSAYNKLIAACRTRLITFHGIDDILVANAPLPPGPDAIIVMTAQLCTASGVPYGEYHHREHPPALALARYATPLTPEVVYPAALLRDIGGVDEGFRIAGDVDLYLRARARCLRIDADIVFVAMRDGGLSASAKGAATVLAENRRIARRHRQAVPLPHRLAAAAFLGARYWLFRLGGERFANRVTDRVRALVGRAPRYALV